MDLYDTLNDREKARIYPERLRSELNELLAADIKKGISEILGNALAGYKNNYKHHDGFVRWGAVEKDIHKLIDNKLCG